DGVEVRLQQRRHPELRGTMSEPFTRAGKAFLLSPRSDLTPRIDAWLQPQLDRRQIEEQMSTALSAAARPLD
ncbi:hypothetical protein LLE87_39165, partial [Paenibacillus polymyxa]|nr:hypothetical protein [Paenibacillus polymyxa]